MCDYNGVYRSLSGLGELNLTAASTCDWMKRFECKSRAPSFEMDSKPVSGPLDASPYGGYEDL